MRWILDDGPFGHLAAIKPQLVSRWQANVLAVAAPTAAAASPLSRQLLDLRTEKGTSVVGQFNVEFGGEDPAAKILEELQRPGQSANYAEHLSIAWAQVHAALDTAFICSDKRAALTALAELGCGRVGHPFDVWCDLYDREWISREEFDRLCELSRKNDPGLTRMPGRVAEHRLSVANPSDHPQAS